MPLTITSCAEAMVLASVAVGSYECGSALGLVMMLISVTWVPPSCRAMLPQKFSAAATTIFPAGSPPAAAAGEAAVEQPAAGATMAAATAAAAQRYIGGVTLIDGLSGQD